MDATTDRGRESGFALLLVIWVMALLAALAASTTLEVRAGLDVARSLVDTSRARSLADSGVWGAIAMLLDERSFVTLRRDGTPQAFPVIGETVTISIEDERAKLDINTVGEVPLRKLFQITGIAQTTAEAMARGLIVYRGTKKRAFSALEELRLVAGFTSERIERIAPFLTVHTDDWRINPATARPEVLLALPDADAALVRRYLALRQELARDEVALRLASPPAVANHAVWGEPRFFTIRATARVESGAVSSRQALVDLVPDDKRPYRIVAWSLSRVD